VHLSRSEEGRHPKGRSEAEEARQRLDGLRSGGYSGRALPGFVDKQLGHATRHRERPSDLVEREGVSNQEQSLPGVGAHDTDPFSREQLPAS
jgi:hypothetical protein